MSEAEWAAEGGCRHQISSLESGTVLDKAFQFPRDGVFGGGGERTLITNIGKPMGKLGWVCRLAWHL